MTLRDHIAGWAEPLMQRFKELYIACQKLQKDIMTYAQLQDELHQKVFGNSNLMEAMSDETLPIRWSMTLSTETQHKYLFILEKGLELNNALIGKSKPLLQEVYDYYEPMYAELMKLDPEKITKETADGILTDIEKGIERLEANYHIVNDRLVACQNNYTEMKNLYKSTLN